MLGSQGPGEPLRAQHLLPVLERQVGAGGRQRHIAEFIDDQQPGRGRKTRGTCPTTSGPETP